mmetsp:Transcript_15851/g.35086  ORF Transcript_15851/g.35086 Transcript_15851/m.35086 type:complete len:257 (-) Transcript_15851:52-822(-)
MPQPNTMTLAFTARFTCPSASLSTTMPLTTVDAGRLPPLSLAIRTLSMFTVGAEAVGERVVMQAFTTSSLSRSSYPHCFVAMHDLRAAFISAGSRTLATVLHTRVGRISSALSKARWYPDMISLVCRPFFTNSSASFSSSPPKDSTKLVLSPYSSSCIWHAMTSIFAAGCCTSNSFMMVAQSLVTNIFSRWLMSNLFIPLGPRDVRTMAAMALPAWMLRMTAPCVPSKFFWPSLSMPCRPAAELRFMDFAILSVLG